MSVFRANNGLITKLDCRILGKVRHVSIWSFLLNCDVTGSGPCMHPSTRCEYSRLSPCIRKIYMYGVYHPNEPMKPTLRAQSSSKQSIHKKHVECDHRSIDVGISFSRRTSSFRKHNDRSHQRYDSPDDGIGLDRWWGNYRACCRIDLNCVVLRMPSLQ